MTIRSLSRNSGPWHPMGYPCTRRVCPFVTPEPTPILPVPTMPQTCWRDCPSELGFDRESSRPVRMDTQACAVQCGRRVHCRERISLDRGDCRAGGRSRPTGPHCKPGGVLVRVTRIGRCGSPSRGVRSGVQYTGVNERTYWPPIDWHTRSVCGYEGTGLSLLL